MAAGAGSPKALRLRECPELNVDDNNIRLIDTDTIATGKVWEWGRSCWKLAQSLCPGRVFPLRRQAPRQHAAGSALRRLVSTRQLGIDGRIQALQPSIGSYSLLKRRSSFAFDRAGIGAWELAARYSVLDLNDNAGVAGAALPLGGVRGGQQKIWTAGLNWYPNNAIRFVLDYQHADVSRLNAAGGDIGAKLDAVSMRAQFSL